MSKRTFGNLWYTVESTKTGGQLWRFGFQPEFVRVIRDQCFSSIAREKRVPRNGLLFSLEMDYGIESFESPVTGILSNISEYLRDCPEKLTENDQIFTLLVDPSNALPQL